MTMTMTINEIIAIHKQILERMVAAPTAEVAAAKKEVAEATGYKASIARSKLRDAEAAVAEHEATVAALKTQLPTDEMSETRVWFAQRFVEYDTKRETRLTAIAALEVQLDAALEEAKKGEWKWAKAAASQIKEGSFVTTLRSQIAEAKKALTDFDATNIIVKRVIERYHALDAQEAEFKAWIDGGPKPEYLRRRDAAEREKFLRECTVLKLPKRGEPYTFNLSVRQPEVEEPSHWVDMTIEDYLTSLMPVAEIKEEEVVTFAPSTPGRTALFVARFKAARKLRQNPTLRISEIS